MFSVVFYDVRTGQTGDMMECLDHMTDRILGLSQLISIRSAAMINGNIKHMYLLENHLEMSTQ